MARNVAECEAMIQACDAAGVPLFVAYYRRCLPHFDQVRKWLNEGAIGQVFAVRLTLFTAAPKDAAAARKWRYDPDIAGGGNLYDLGSHQMDVLDHLLGPVGDVEGRAVNLAGHYAVEDTVSARFTFESGVEGTALWCFATAPCATQDELHFIGAQGTISVACFGAAAATLVTSAGAETFEAPAPDHVQQGLITTIVQELQGAGSCPSTGRTALRTARVLDRIAGKI